LHGWRRFVGLGWPRACKMVVAANTQGGVLLAGVG
jgi:hypothetical protein